MEVGQAVDPQSGLLVQRQGEDAVVVPLRGDQAGRIVRQGEPAQVVLGGDLPPRHGTEIHLVARILEDTGLEARALELEVTESLLMKDAEGAVQTLRALKSIGVQLAIDDFGTGYSSLSYLKQFPIDRLKIDRTFVHNISEDRDNAAIALAVIAMAESMALKVTAEGVETEAQLSFLRDHGCDEYQGYLFSPPVPADEFEKLVRAARGKSA